MKRNASLAEIAQRLEISFWNTFIRLLSHPRRGSILLAVGLGYLIIGSGLFLGTYSLYQGLRTAHAPAISRGAERSQSVEEIRQHGLPQHSLQQHNLLIVVVDQLALTAESPSATQLQAVWYVAYLPSLQRLTAMPVFPAEGSQGQLWNDQLLSRFGLDGHGNLPRDFLALIQEQELSWEAVVVLDQAALRFWQAELARYGELPAGVQLSSLQEGRIMDASGNLPVVAQAQFGEALCRSSVVLLQELDPFAVVAELQAEVRTALDPALVILEWMRLKNSGSGLICEFPILQVEESASGALLIREPDN